MFAIPTTTIANTLWNSSTLWQVAISQLIGYRCVSTSKRFRLDKLFLNETRQRAEDASAPFGLNEVPSADVNAEHLVKKLTKNVEHLVEERKFLREQNNSIMNKYSRAMLEYENLRERMTRQVEDARNFGIQKFCKDLVEVADILGKATAAVPCAELNAQNPHLKNLFEGLISTQACLLQTFRRHGLVCMNPLHEKFNPNLHEALFERSTSDVEPNTIIEVTKYGYKLNKRLLRPALVGVAKSP